MWVLLFRFVLVLCCGLHCVHWVLERHCFPCLSVKHLFASILIHAPLAQGCCRQSSGDSGHCWILPSYKRLDMGWYESVQNRAAMLLPVSSLAWSAKPTSRKVCAKDFCKASLSISRDLNRTGPRRFKDVWGFLRFYLFDHLDKSISASFTHTVIVWPLNSHRFIAFYCDITEQQLCVLSRFHFELHYPLYFLWPVWHPESYCSPAFSFNFATMQRIWVVSASNGTPLHCASRSVLSQQSGRSELFSQHYLL